MTLLKVNRRPNGIPTVFDMFDEVMNRNFSNNWMATKGEFIPSVNIKETEKALVKADITCNKNMVPFDDKSAFITSGIRLGTAAITTRGLKENDMETIASLISEVVDNINDTAVLSNVKTKVNELMEGKALFNY